MGWRSTSSCRADGCWLITSLDMKAAEICHMREKHEGDWHMEKRLERRQSWAKPRYLKGYVSDNLCWLMTWVFYSEYMCHQSVRKPRHRTHSCPAESISTSGRGLLGLKHAVKYECRGLRTLGWHHTISMEVCFFTSEEGVPFTSIVLDFAATLFTPETPEVICGLTLHPTLHWHSGEWIMSELKCFSFIHLRKF